jgi:hypothetical protein
MRRLDSMAVIGILKRFTGSEEAAGIYDSERPDSIQRG